MRSIPNANSEQDGMSGMIKLISLQVVIPLKILKNPLATSSHYYWWVNKNPAPLDRQFIPLFAGKTHPRWLFGISSINSINDKHKMFQDALLLVVAPPRSLISWVHTDEALPLHTTCRSQVWHVNISDICDLYIYIVPTWFRIFI